MTEKISDISGVYVKASLKEVSVFQLKKGDLFFKKSVFSSNENWKWYQVLEDSVMESDTEFSVLVEEVPLSALEKFTPRSSYVS